MIERAFRRQGAVQRSAAQRTANVFVLVGRLLIARVQSKEHYYVQQYAVSSTEVVKEEDKLSEF